LEYAAETRRAVAWEVVTRLVVDREVELRLVSQGPPQQPVITFRLEPEVVVDSSGGPAFVNDISRPLTCCGAYSAYTTRQQTMHRKDLDGLRRYAGPVRIPCKSEKLADYRGGWLLVPVVDVGLLVFTHVDAHRAWRSLQSGRAKDGQTIGTQLCYWQDVKVYCYEPKPCLHLDFVENV
jgi:hypothetical protein